MKTWIYGMAAVIVFCGLVSAQALDTAKWPPDTDFTQEVHYWSAEEFLPIPAGSRFEPTLIVQTGGDQVAEDIVIGDRAAKKATMIYFNVADELFDVWPDVPLIDVLVQYFANAESKRADFGFLLGQLGNLHGVGGYTFESVTDQWEWRLFRIDNAGGWTGNQIDPSIGGSQYGGVNNGTIRFERVTGVIFGVVAFGPQGVFGEPEVINAAQAVEFDPDQYAISAEWDINKGIKDGLDLYKVTSGDQETVQSDNIGPAGDKRKAIRPAMGDGTDAIQDPYVNWQILDTRFGPSSQPSTRVKIVAEYYDDPALAGQTFGPEAYVTAGGGIAFYPAERRTTLEGSGKWREALWYVTDVKFNGVNVQLQAAARFHFTGPIYISRLRIGVIRTSGIYEGVDPIPGVYPFDPDPYEIYAELDLNQGVEIGLTRGSSGGDQEYFVEDGVGPAGDLRTAICPALGDGTDTNFDRYMNFAIVDQWFGPNSQPNAVLKVAVDYYDDPALAGQRFGPEVYQTDVYGQLQIKFYPDAQRLTLEGTDTWRTAAWQIDDVNFTGVNQGPQAAVRFWFTDGCAVYISRVRYAVIRPVGKYAGVDSLADVPITAVENWELH
jgi:hypothetical protein